MEAGFTNDDNRPAPMIALVFRLMHPQLMHKLTDVDESMQLTIKETKGVFGLLAMGCLFVELEYLKPKMIKHLISLLKIFMKHLINFLKVLMAILYNFSFCLIKLLLLLQKAIKITLRRFPCLN